MLKLDIGCGHNKKEGFVGVDKISLPEVDVVCDIENGLPFGDGSVDEIRCIQVLEHVKNLVFVMEEFWRICKNKAQIEILVPYWNRVGSFRDTTHCRFFTYRTFDHFTNATKFPNYYSKVKFNIVYRKIIFATSKKDGLWFLLYLWEKLKEKFANSFPDIYENTWLKIFGARHLKIILEVKK